MVNTASELAVVIERYRRVLVDMGIRSRRILLFGSYARGTTHDDSDIDLIVISDDWVPYCQRERQAILGIAAARILEPIQARGITPDEIAEHRLSRFWEEMVTRESVPIS